MGLLPHRGSCLLSSSFFSVPIREIVVVFVIVKQHSWSFKSENWQFVRFLSSLWNSSFFFAVCLNASFLLDYHPRFLAGKLIARSSRWLGARLWPDMLRAQHIPRTLCAHASICRTDDTRKERIRIHLWRELATAWGNKLQERLCRGILSFSFSRIAPQTVLHMQGKPGWASWAVGLLSDWCK